MSISNVELQDVNGNVYYPRNTASVVNYAGTTVEAALNDMIIPLATGTATAIVVPMLTLVNGYSKTFIASANNNGAATTINGKPFYRPGTTISPKVIGGRSYTVWYDLSKAYFFIKASAEGTAIATDVLAGKTFTNDDGDLYTGSLDLSSLVSANIKAGITINGVAGKSSVVDTANATAVASQILASSTAYVNGTKVTGTLNLSSLVSANIKAGITINGVTGKSSVVDTADATAVAGQMIVGTIAYVNGAKITGTLDLSYLVSANIKAGVTINGVAGKLTVVDTAGATAGSNQILFGYTAYTNGAKATGSMPLKGDATYVAGTVDQYINPGVYLDRKLVIAGDANLISANIKSGVTIFGVAGKSTVVDTADAIAIDKYILAGSTAYARGVKITGTLNLSSLVPANIKAGITINGVTGKSSVVDTADATADSNQILLGYTSYINGTKATGSIPSKGDATYVAGTVDQYINAGVYLDRKLVIAGDPDLIYDNIRGGVNIFGVPGNPAVVNTSDAAVAASQMIVGTTAYVNGNKVTGTMPIIAYNANSVASKIARCMLYMKPSPGYYTGGTDNWIYLQDFNFDDKYIVKGNTIFGLAGTATVNSMGGVNIASGTGTNYGQELTVPYLPFTPRIVLFAGGPGYNEKYYGINDPGIIDEYQDGSMDFTGTHQVQGDITINGKSFYLRGCPTGSYGWMIWE